MAGLAGLEPAAFRLGVRRSIHLSYSPARVTMLCARALPVNHPGTPGPSTQNGPARPRRNLTPSASTPGTQIGRWARAEWRASPSMRCPAGEPRRRAAPTKPGARMTDCPATSSRSNEIDSAIASLEPSAEMISQQLPSLSPCLGEACQKVPSSAVESVMDHRPTHRPLGISKTGSLRPG